MEGINISRADANTTKDYSYYGNGCPNDWGTGGDGGSLISCVTRITETKDNEPQKNGTYFSFQAGTVGSGGGINADNTITPDSFCPLGWQLPYGGTSGDYYDQPRSWKYLFDDYGIVFNLAGKLKMTSYPLSYIQSGIYIPGSGVYRMSVAGYYYSGTISDFYGAYGFRPMDWDTGPNVTFDNVAALSLRCVSVLTS